MDAAILVVAATDGVMPQTRFFKKTYLINKIKLGILLNQIASIFPKCYSYSVKYHFS